MDKQKFTGDWKCGKCGGAITELPFEPKNTDNLTCKECYLSGKGKTAPKQNNAERKMFKGDWKCGKCGGAITQLPFEPKSVSNLTCLDCFRKSQG